MEQLVELLDKPLADLMVFSTLNYDVEGMSALTLDRMLQI